MNLGKLNAYVWGIGGFMALYAVLEWILLFMTADFSRISTRELALTSFLLTWILFYFILIGIIAKAVLVLIEYWEEDNR